MRSKKEEETPAYVLVTGKQTKWLGPSHKLTPELQTVPLSPHRVPKTVQSEHIESSINSSQWLGSVDTKVVKYEKYLQKNFKRS